MPGLIIGYLLPMAKIRSFLQLKDTLVAVSRLRKLTPHLHRTDALPRDSGAIRQRARGGDRHLSGNKQMAVWCTEILI